jgi:two-component system OmpR family response regulator
MRALTTYIVEDSPLIRDNLIATLEELGPVRVVGSAEDEAGARCWLAGPGPGADLLIVDLFLKSGSGLAVLAAARARGPSGRTGPPQRRSQVVVLSNYATPAMRERCLALGADRVFDKSHEIEALLAFCTELARQLDTPGDGTGAAA